MIRVLTILVFVGSLLDAKHVSVKTRPTAKPIALLSSTGLSFPSQTVGTVSAPQSVTLSNTGNATLSISSITITGANAPDFGRSTTCGSSVAAGASCTINVTFTPSVAATETAAISITDNSSTGTSQSVSLSGTGQSGNTGGTVVTPWSMVNFYVYDNMPASSIDGHWAGITHLAVGDFHVSSTGAISYIFSPGTLFPPAVSAAHANGVKALVVLSDTASGDNLAYAFANNQTALFNNIASVIATYGFDGIQVDWEKSFPYSNTQATLGGFFQALRAKLGSSVLIAADAFPAGGPYGVVSQTQWNTAIPYIDKLAIMTYDLLTQVTGTYSWFNSPLYNAPSPDSQASSVEQSMRLFSTGTSVPTDKLLIGIPFYGWTYNNASAPRLTSGSPGSQANYSSLFNAYTLATANYDANAHVPWLPNGTGYITFDNETSIGEKISFVKGHGYGGWIVFNLFGDYLPSQPSSHPLLDAIAASMAVQ